MARLKYVIVETDADWEEHLYHAVVPVRRGEVVTDDPLTIEALLYRGFQLIDEPKVAARNRQQRD